jgi:FkbM family methyltransferase
MYFRVKPGVSGQQHVRRRKKDYDRAHDNGAMDALRTAIKYGFRPSKLQIVSRKYMKELRAANERLLASINENGRAADDLALLESVPDTHVVQLLKLLHRSRSQLRQDLFALSTANFKQNGYFVEFGATDGVWLSNSYLLETAYGWSGILAEPGRCWHAALRANRRAFIETECVWWKTGETLLFREASEPELSTIQEYSSIDHHRERRRGGKDYPVRTISLVDLLDKYAAPKHIDYLSIDTEGSEYDILSHFDFKGYSFGVITCEHNSTPVREQIFDLLTSKGYERKFEVLSQFDDWYVRRS